MKAIVEVRCQVASNFDRVNGLLSLALKPIWRVCVEYRLRIQQMSNQLDHVAIVGARHVVPLRSIRHREIHD